MLKRKGKAGVGFFLIFICLFFLTGWASIILALSHNVSLFMIISESANNLC